MVIDLQAAHQGDDSAVGNMSYLPGRAEHIAVQFEVTAALRNAWDVAAIAAVHKA